MTRAEAARINGRLGGRKTKMALCPVCGTPRRNYRCPKCYRKKRAAAARRRYVPHPRRERTGREIEGAILKAKLWLRTWARNRHRSKVGTKGHKYTNRQARELTDWYVRHRLSVGTKVPRDKWPGWLVKLKRAVLILKRAIWSHEKTAKPDTHDCRGRSCQTHCPGAAAKVGCHQAPAELQNRRVSRRSHPPKGRRRL